MDAGTVFGALCECAAGLFRLFMRRVGVQLAGEAHFDGVRLTR